MANKNKPMVLVAKTEVEEQITLTERYSGSSRKALVIIKNGKYSACLYFGLAHDLTPDDIRFQAAVSKKLLEIIGRKK